jgi:4-hydroxybenzoate polyprenyltransferase
MIHALKMLFATSRPISWVNTAYPFAAGYLLQVGVIDVTWVVGTLFFLIPYNLLMYGINDVCDYESDMRNPRKGGIEGAVTPKSEHRLIVISSIVLCVPFVVYMMIVGHLWANITLLSVLFFVIAYSAPRLRFKEIPFLDSVTSSIHFVGPLVYALVLTEASLGAWPFVVAFFLWGVASQAFGAVQDIVPDRAASIKSIATVLGARFTVYFSTILYVCAALMTITQGGMAAIVGIVGFTYAVNTMQYWRISDPVSEHAHKGWRRFLWINYAVGAILTIVLIATRVTL